MAEAPKAKPAASKTVKLITKEEYSLRDHVTGIKFTREQPQEVDLDAEDSSYVRTCVAAGILVVVKEPEPEAPQA